MAAPNQRGLPVFGEEMKDETKTWGQEIKTPTRLHELASDANFNESAYLAGNPDVAAAVKSGALDSGWRHFDMHGRTEGRRQRYLIDLIKLKRQKLDRIASVLRSDLERNVQPDHFDFLTPELRSQFNIIDTSAVSSNDYDADVLALIQKHQHGLMLDCGAGSRSTYYQNVVNFEIAMYPSTDVRGVGEVLPFKDNSFDAVVSIAVLEHVKDPWQCAREILRVLKPGGDLLCAVPFLQPMHGYPHHYYNMTETGLRNLFGDAVEVTRHEVPDSVLPIWSLTWMLDSWAAGLEGQALDEFKNLRVADLMGDARAHVGKSYVAGLSKAKNMEIASATVLHGRKL